MSCSRRSPLCLARREAITSETAPGMPSKSVVTITTRLPFSSSSARALAELRRGVLTPEKILGRVDALRTQLQESQVRNNQKWRVIGRELQGNSYVGPTYDAEVNWMKVWIKDRLTWIDRQFPAAPKPAAPGR